MASSVQSNLEAAAQALGVDISDSYDDVQPQTQQTAPIESPAVEEPIAQESETINAPEEAQSSESSLSPQAEPEVPEDIDSMMLNYLNEKFGTSLTSLNDFNAPQVQQEPVSSVPESIKVIADFVQQTGRSPEDWFRYQQMNPSEMDDTTVVRISLASENPDLTARELDLLMERKYKLDEDRYDESEVEYSKLQLKLDAKKARKEIDDVRNGFQLPIKEETAPETTSPIDENWVSSMSRVVDNMEGLTFEVAKGKEFTFSLEDQYKTNLKDKNVQLDQFFDPYVDESGNWNHELLSSHRAIIDNIDALVSAVYAYGLSDGQRKIVEKAANIDASSPTQQTRDSNPVEEQIINAFLGGDKMMRFK